MLTLVTPEPAQTFTFLRDSSGIYVESRVLTMSHPPFKLTFRVAILLLLFLVATLNAEHMHGRKRHHKLNGESLKTTQVPDIETNGALNETPLSLQSNVNHSIFSELPATTRPTASQVETQSTVHVSVELTGVGVTFPKPVSTSDNTKTSVMSGHSLVTSFAHNSGAEMPIYDMAAILGAGQATTPKPKMNTTTVKQSSSTTSDTVNDENLPTCSKDSDCVGKILGYSGCLKGNCHCAIGSIFKTFPNGSLACELLNCGDDESICQDHGWECTTQDYCTCDKDSTESVSYLECLSTYECNTTAECTEVLRGSMCFDEECHCPMGYTEREGVCVKIICDKDSDCPPFGSVCDTDTGHCVCDAGHSLKDNGMHCVEVATLRAFGIIMLILALGTVGSFTFAYYRGWFIVPPDEACSVSSGKPMQMANWKMPTSMQGTQSKAMADKSCKSSKSANFMTAKSKSSQPIGASKT